MTGTLYNAVTQSVAMVGVGANALLVVLILTRSPNYMRTYAYLLISSAIGDLVGLISIIATLPREVIYEELLVVQFQGFCVAFSEDACWYAFGAVEWMLSTTCALLTASFALRLAILNNADVQKLAVTKISILSVAVFSPTLWIWKRVFTIGSPYAQKTSISTIFVTNATQLGMSAQRFVQYPRISGIIDQTDGFTQVFLNSTILLAMILFLTSIILRSVIMRRLHAVQDKLSAQARRGHDMLIRALNIQLPVTAFYFTATVLYVLNAADILNGDYVDYWTTPIANLQNVLTPIVNLWFIQPYRKSILNFLSYRRTEKAPSTVRVESFSNNMTSIA